MNAVEVFVKTVEQFRECSAEDESISDWTVRCVHKKRTPRNPRLERVTCLEGLKAVLDIDFIYSCVNPLWLADKNSIVSFASFNGDGCRRHTDVSMRVDSIPNVDIEHLQVAEMQLLFEDFSDGIYNNVNPQSRILVAFYTVGHDKYSLYVGDVESGELMGLCKVPISSWTGVADVKSLVINPKYVQSQVEIILALTLCTYWNSDKYINREFGDLMQYSFMSAALGRMSPLVTVPSIDCVIVEEILNNRGVEYDVKEAKDDYNLCGGRSMITSIIDKTIERHTRLALENNQIK